MAQQSRSIGLVQVTGDQPNEKPGVGIDIIAIHGLGAKSPDTWTWKDRKDPKTQVNWLSDPKMLPSVVGSARIFTCDWPADMFQTLVPTTI
ncbi:hypothetical protein ACO1O0_007853 [Amphichorda felina]